MADSWEDQEEQIVLQPKPSSTFLNPNAPTFSFNPGASTFTPSFQPPPPPARAIPNGTAEVPMPAPSDTPMPPAEQDPPLVATDRGEEDIDMDDSPEHPSNDAEVAAESVASDMENLRVSEPTPAPAPPEHEEKPAEVSKPSTIPAVEEDEDDHMTEEARQKREAQLKRVYDMLSKADTREHMNIVFIGHVDAGKSTTGGQILYLTGGVDERTIQKYEKEAKDKNRESWYMAYIMDTNEEERAKGKTVEVGRAQFTTAKKRYTILDAPGHKNYVPNMISGASQADVGVLVVAARKGEFETGFERGGQTREHAQLAKTLGVTKLIIAVNKMDDPSVAGPKGEWNKERYDEIVNGITPFLRSCGYNPKRDLVFLPMSGLLGTNIKDPCPPGIADWYKGGTLFDVLDNVDPFMRDPLAPFRMSVVDKYKDMGTIAMGKSESGIVMKNDRLYVMPNKVSVTVTTIYRDDEEVEAAKGGENLRLRLAGIEEGEIMPGFIICSRHIPAPAVTFFEAQLQVLDLGNTIFTAGYKAVLHVHSLVEECEITTLVAQIDPKTKEKKRVKFVKSGSIVIARIEVEKPICVEKFDIVPQLGRFTLRDEGRTIAIGKIIKLPKSLKA